MWFIYTLIDKKDTAFDIDKQRIFLLISAKTQKGFFFLVIHVQILYTLCQTARK